MADASERDAPGSSIIPASQRPDGTWRKPRRVKDGYIPQDEVPLYESKGKQFAAKRENYIPGLPSEMIAEMKARRQEAQSKNNRCPIPGLIIQPNENKKKKKKNPADEITEAFTNVSLATNKKPQPTPTDPAKRLKNLRKKLREIEVLKKKLETGELQNPEKDQLEKIKNRDNVLSEISRLESEL